MAKHGKKYGYTIALWELGNTVPGLFRLIGDYKKEKRIKTTDLWKSMIKASWVPIPFRIVLSLLPWRDASGDEWNLCHYWSNFEIADMDFFRSREYREFFDFLDRKGGFYLERASKLNSLKLPGSRRWRVSGETPLSTHSLRLYSCHPISSITSKTLGTFMNHGGSTLRMLEVHNYRIPRHWRWEMDERAGWWNRLPVRM